MALPAAASRSRHDDGSRTCLPPPGGRLRAMASITYFDLEGSAPRVTWRGVPFRDGEVVVLDDARHAELIDQASTHPWFSVDRDDAADADEPEASALEVAAGFLTRALANGPVPQAAVMADADT